MEKDRKELRKLLEDALQGLGEKEELVERLAKIEKKIDALDKKLDKLNKALDKPAKDDPLQKILDKIEREREKGNPPWSLPPNWPPYRATFETCPMGGEHEYPSDWACILPAPCKKCGKTAPNLYGTTGKGWQDGLQSWHATSSEHYLDDPHGKSLRLSETLHESLNSPIVPEGASIVSNDRVTTSEGVSQTRETHFGLTAKPRDKNNVYWKF